MVGGQAGAMAVQTPLAPAVTAWETVTLGQFRQALTDPHLLPPPLFSMDRLSFVFSRSEASGGACGSTRGIPGKVI